MGHSHTSQGLRDTTTSSESDESTTTSASWTGNLVTDFPANDLRFFLCLLMGDDEEVEGVGGAVDDDDVDGVGGAMDDDDEVDGITTFGSLLVLLFSARCLRFSLRAANKTNAASRRTFFLVSSSIGSKGGEPGICSWFF